MLINAKIVDNMIKSESTEINLDVLHFEMVFP